MPGCPDSPKPEVVFNLQMMMSLGVADLNAWWQYIEQKEFTKKYAGIMCKPPGTQPRGIRVLYLSDPTGVLWHILENPR